jgi:hypothetical protein
MNSIRQQHFFIRLLHWEYWNSTVVYAPLYPYWLWLSIKARSFFFLTAANPAIRNGGFIMESKTDVYKILPQGTYPETLFFEHGTSFEQVTAKIKTAAITFPLIAKPDQGERGLGVKKIENTGELKEYVLHMPVDFIVQPYIAYGLEVGIFYYRMPGGDNGTISGMVHKEMVAVEGDGQKTVAELVRQNPRYLLQWKYIVHANNGDMNTILQKGERKVLVPYGNHSRGSKFTDVTDKVTPQLTEIIDNVCKQIEGFYFGRLDVKFNSWEELEKGEKFSIIELNGSGSEPTHIYDPKHSIFWAWKEIVRHWDVLYAISKINKQKGAVCLNLLQGRREVLAFKNIETKLAARSW